MGLDEHMLLLIKFNRLFEYKECCCESLANFEMLNVSHCCIDQMFI